MQHGTSFSLRFLAASDAAAAAFFFFELRPMGIPAARGQLPQSSLRRDTLTGVPKTPTDAVVSRNEPAARFFARNPSEIGFTI